MSAVTAFLLGAVAGVIAGLVLVLLLINWVAGGLSRLWHGS